ncbi:hypothetical protein E0Z10_g1106 [Xylaria hypoxylon]|uniref:Cytochrome c oxidase assembly factor 3 n=1 Tax=Xylaria hypoxylon TaxID=37992 RepID=A0A4Z0YTF0_9PEZI|nr:hypothetical protein E0Z10_g1106 [Xylaria hypoxylon]
MPSGFGSSSYYNRQSRQSPALIRARKPYLVKNAVVGSAVAAFALGVSQHGILIWVILWLDIYTIRAIGQDEFEDVKVPDAPARSS